GVTDEVIDYVAAIVRRSRELPSVELGASPRAGTHLLAAAKARARLAQRGYVTPDDVAEAAPGVLRHRLVLRPEAELERYSGDDPRRWRGRGPRLPGPAWRPAARGERPPGPLPPGGPAHARPDRARHGLRDAARVRPRRRHPPGELARDRTARQADLESVPGR